MSKLRDVQQEVKSVLQLLDGMAPPLGADDVFRHCRERLRVIAEQPCDHSNSRVIRDGMLGEVICNDCGYSRDWNAY
jgi:hypothetical protein